MLSVSTACSLDTNNSNCTNSTFAKHWKSLKKTSSYNDKLNYAIIKKFNIDPNVLFGRLNSIVTGSFISSTLLDEVYDGSDIDIYNLVNHPKTSKFPSELPDNDIDKYITEELHGVYYGASDYNDEAYKYLTPMGIINIIIITPDDLEYAQKSNVQEYIASITDLDICGSTYDGNELTYPVNLFKKKINIVNRHLGKFDQTNEEYLRDIDKYIKREISIFSNRYLESSYNPLITRLFRIMKYSERNFKIYDEGVLFDISKYLYIMEAYEKYKHKHKTYVNFKLDVLFYTIRKILENEKLEQPIYRENYLGNCLRFEGTLTRNRNIYHWTKYLTRENNKWIEGWLQLFEKSKFVDKEIHTCQNHTNDVDELMSQFNIKFDTQIYYLTSDGNTVRTHHKLIFDTEKNVLDLHNTSMKIKYDNDFPPLS